MRYSLEYAVSQRIVTPQTVAGRPKSNSIHCGSDAGLLHRVSRRPSQAYEAG